MYIIVFENVNGCHKNIGLGAIFKKNNNEKMINSLIFFMVFLYF